MGMIDDCEASLQVLRGFETDINSELNEIKVIVSSNWSVDMLQIHFSRIR